jgi:4-hydroxy-2-oxoheptanedioate aldolase
MRPNPLREAHAAKRPALIGWSGMGSPYAAELVGSSGVDAVLVDMQHGQVYLEQAMLCLQAIGATGATPLARCTDRNFGEINKLLDSGAMGIVCPMIDTAEQAADFVSICTYPPVGRRSFGPLRATIYYGEDYFAMANAGGILKIVMIETKTGLANADAIMATPGVDAVLIGPSDMSLALTDNPTINFKEGPLPVAMKSILETAHKHGKLAYAWCSTAEMAQAMVRMGFDGVVPGNDAAVLRAAYQERVKAIRSVTP